ncbi:MAG: NADH-quinone oxidoreductase subunit NuoE [Clostridia bacterium]|nr:NADH-quinone oxidoreductase subunit NuoE [Clostridia bacterium]
MAEKIIQPFHETEEQKQKLVEVIDRNKDIPGALLPILHEAQEIYGYLPIEIQQRVADGLGISLSEVYGVATFYSRFSLTPKGKHRVSVCLGTACYVKGADKVLAEVEKKLGIKSGECTEDGLFSIDSCRCVGACGLAPVMMIGEEVYGKLTPAMVDKILDKYIKEEGASK